MADLLLADISEFQQNIDADTYIRGGHPALICRTHNGNRPDHMMPGRRDYLRGKPFTSLGWYQYLVKDRDPASQARDFIATVGALRPNEFPVLDLEEGPGNQVPRAEAWFRVVDRWAGFQSTLYTGSSMLTGQLGGPGRWGRRPLWIAAYYDYTPNPRNEPRGCTFWQYTDRAKFPGLAGGVDGSIYHGTAERFAARVRPGGARPVTMPRGQLVVARSGELTEAFVERPSGEIVHNWQRGRGGAWSGWRSMGTPGR
jgi:GH25 family lysozyme M1 (1,4-beta-N-acetylmuramidase)